VAITHTESKVHWSFFIALEQDVEVITRYIEPAAPNLTTYSLELCRIVLAASAECEVVLKELARFKTNQSSDYDIRSLRETLMQCVPELASEKVFIRRYGLELDPWDNWRSGKTPNWWQSYNKVKHERVLHYAEANLTNALNAVAALMIAVIFYYRAIGNNHYEHVPTALQPSLAKKLQDIVPTLTPESRLFFLNYDRYPSHLLLE
jgi:hypothetical protein